MAINIPILMVAEFLRGLYFAYAVATLFYISIGINYTQLSILWLAMALVQALLEIPFGIVSDRLGHRATILLGYAAFCCTMILIGSGVNLWLPLLGGAMWGVSSALLSGATDAFLYDSLKQEGRQHLYLKMKGRHAMVLSLGIVAGAIPGAYLYKLNGRFPWYAHAASIALAFCIFLFSKNTPASAQAASNLTHWDHCRSSLRYIRGHKALLWLTIVTTLGMLPLYGMSMARQPYLVSRHVQVDHLGYAFSLMHVLGSVAGMLAHRIEKALGLSRSLILAIALLMVLFLQLCFTTGYWATVPMALLYACFRFLQVVLNAHSNHRIPSELRATILSVQSMGGTFFLIAFMLTSGVILDCFSLNLYMLLMTGYLGVCVLPLWLLRKRFGIDGRIA